MTTPPAQPEHTHGSATGPDANDDHDPLGLSQLVASGVIDVVPGDPPVPITVWRVADPDTPPRGTLSDSLAGRTAHLLVGLYTRPGDMIVSIGDDPTLAGAAGAGGRRYRPVDEPADLADLDHVAGAVQLLVLRWPPANRPPTADQGTDDSHLTALFTACRLLMARDGYTVVAVAAGHTGRQAERAWQLVPAARRCGLGWLEHIIAVTAPIAGERLNVPGAPVDKAIMRAAGEVHVHIDLYVLVIRGGQHG
jgi:hypothetical protein